MSPDQFPRVPLSRQRDALPLIALALLAIIVSFRAFADVASYIRGDWPTMFVPIYAFLGERLRDFDIPGWNPYQFSGAPFAGDPSSGWMYLPAMAIYALLPVLPATATFIGFHIVLAAIAAYLLARLTALSPAGAFVGGVAFVFPWFIPAAASAVLMMQVLTWLPISLIGVELASREHRPSLRLAGLGVSGLALSQILAAWLGQAAYYSLLVFGGWVAWRCLVTAPRISSARQRLFDLILVGGGSLVLAFALNAAALLVRLDANSRSNAAGGIYTGISGWADTKLGQPLDAIARTLIGGFSSASWQYVGAAVVALALLAPLLAWRWPPLAFWIIVPIVGIILTLPGETLLRSIAFALLPRFELIHSHLPDRILMVVPLSAAMLAAATTDALTRGIPIRWEGRSVAIVAALGLAGVAAYLQRGGLITAGALWCALAVLFISVVVLVVPKAVHPAIVAVALAAVILWDPTGRALAAGWGDGAGPQRSLNAALEGELDTFLFANGAAEFLREATADNPGRYAGYDPAVLPDPAEFGDLPPQLYRNQWLGPANWLLVHNWGMWFGVDDIQGYNPIHIRRYGEYIDALNGHRQEYHETDLFPTAFASPLLPPLNMRYLIVPADAPDRADLESLLAAMPTVYSDDRVLVLENKDASPRAWMVHEARQVAPDEVLPLLTSGDIDPATTALLEAPPPPLEQPASDAPDSARVVLQQPDEVLLEASTTAGGLLMLSQIWDPGWTATIDGQSAPIYQANYVFSAIPIGAGDHVIELRYTPPLLWPGLAITLGSATALILGFAYLVRRERRPLHAITTGQTV